LVTSGHDPAGSSPAGRSSRPFCSGANEARLARRASIECIWRRAQRGSEALSADCLGGSMGHFSPDDCATGANSILLAARQFHVTLSYLNNEM